jgi:hypothetical protein
MPHFEAPIHRELDTIISDIDSFFSIVDYVSVFHLVGGEPFLYPNIEGVVRHIVDNYIDRIDKLIITTNGTILPKQSMIEVLKSNPIILSVSDYTDKLENIKKKVVKVLDAYKENNVINEGIEIFSLLCPIPLLSSLVRCWFDPFAELFLPQSCHFFASLFQRKLHPQQATRVPILVAADCFPSADCFSILIRVRLV